MDKQHHGQEDNYVSLICTWTVPLTSPLPPLQELEKSAAPEASAFLKPRSGSVCHERRARRGNDHRFLTQPITCEEIVAIRWEILEGRWCGIFNSFMSTSVLLLLLFNHYRTTIMFLDKAGIILNCSEIVRKMSQKTRPMTPPDCGVFMVRVRWLGKECEGQSQLKAEWGRVKCQPNRSKGCICWGLFLAVDEYTFGAWRVYVGITVELLVSDQFIIGCDLYFIDLMTVYITNVTL